MNASSAPFADRLARMVVRHRVLVLVVTALLILASLPLALNVPYDASSDIWFLESDPSQQAWDRCQEIFGIDSFLLVFTEVTDGTVFENDLLASLERLTLRLERIRGVRQAAGLTRYESLRGGDGFLDVGRTVPVPPADPAELARAEGQILNDPLAVPALVTADGRLTTILVEIDPAPSDFQDRLDLIREIREALTAETAASGIPYQLTGEPVLSEDLFQKSRRDLKTLFPASILLITALLALTTRSRVGTVVPLILVLGAVSMSRALIPLLGWRDNGLLGVLPMVVLSVGIADSVHIVTRFFALRENLGDSASAAAETVRDLFKPCLLTTLTTAVGFAALTTASLTPLRQLGVIAAAGVTVALVLSLLALPAALSLLPPAVASQRGRYTGGPLAWLIGMLPRVIERGRIPILLLAVGLTLAGAAGYPRLRVESNSLAYFNRDDPVRLLGEFAEERVGGLTILENLVTADEPGGVCDLEVLAAMERLEHFLEEQDLVTGAHSLAGPLRAVNRAMHGDDPAYERLPDDGDLVAQYLLLHETASEGSGLDAYVDLPRRHARVWGRVRFSSSTEYEALRRATEDFARATFPAGTSVEVTGIVTLFAKMSDLIVSSQVRSFLAAMVLITITLVIAFGSVRLGLLSLIPNMWPIALTAGFMGWAGIPLDPGTAMVAAVAIGIAVDDTVHFIHAYREKRAAKVSDGAPVRGALRASGRAVISTTLILLCGFGTSLGSEFRLASSFGGLCMTALFLALVADLLILPALLPRDRRA